MKHGLETDRSQSHYKVVAKSPKELLVRGDYLEIAVGNIILDAEVLADCYSGTVEHYALFEVVYSNLWDYVISTTSWNAPSLIDSNGFQHSACSLLSEAMIHKAKNFEPGTELPSVADEIQGKARSVGWIAFPRLKKSVVPHRLIFQFRIFEPGQTSGYVQHSETLELIFDLSVYGRLLSEGKKRR